MNAVLERIPSRAREVVPSLAATRLLLTGVVLLSLAAKLLLIHRGGVEDRTLFEMEYGFGPVIRSLYERGSLEACGVAIGLDFCGVAGRMPLLPWLYAAAGKLIGIQQIHLAVAKSIALSLPLWAALQYLCGALRAFPLQRLGLLLLSALLFLGPQYLKHSISVQYEESLLIDLFSIYFLALGALLAKRETGEAWSRLDRGVVLAMVALGSALYFIKSSLVLFGVAAILAPLVAIRAALRTQALALVPFAAALLWWGGVNYAYHGDVRLASSYDGENFYRGQNAYSYQVYPDLHLDRLLDADEAQLSDGTRVSLPRWQRRYPVFHSEWEWNDHFRGLALQWIREHPVDAFLFTLRKAYVFFVEPRKVPFRLAALPEAEPQHYSSLALLAGPVWIGALRLLFGAALARALRALWTERRLAPRATFFLLFAAAYSGPYLAGFAYQRHIAPFLLFCAIYLVPLTLPSAQAASRRR